MFVPVCIEASPVGYTIWPPDFPECRSDDTDRGRALTRVHLRLEGVISNRFIDGQALPPVRSIDELRYAPEYAESTLSVIHINETHLRAVARHQTRFGEPDGL